MTALAKVGQIHSSMTTHQLLSTLRMDKYGEEAVAKAAFKRAMAVDSLQKLVIEPLKKFEERMILYKCYVSSLQGASVALNIMSVTEDKAGRSAMVREFKKLCEDVGATPLALVTNWLAQLVASGGQ